jgi:hypothetical protein
MIKSLAIAALAGACVLGAPAIAQAHGNQNNHWGDGDDEGSKHHHGRAPEPATIVGLSLGVAGIVGARWAWRRRKASPKR